MADENRPDRDSTAEGCEALRAGTPADAFGGPVAEMTRMLAIASGGRRTRAELARLHEEIGQFAGRAERDSQGNPRSGGGCLFSFLAGTSATARWWWI